MGAAIAIGSKSSASCDSRRFFIFNGGFPMNLVFFLKKRGKTGIICLIFFGGFVYWVLGDLSLSLK